MAFTVVGLTGGIGSGKSTVARCFAELGVPIVDADRIARDVVQPGTPGLAAVAAAFGPEVLAADGTLDRAALGRRVFADAAARAQLEGILHPRIAMESAEQFARLANEGHPYAVYEAALLVETKRHEHFGALIVVAASEEVQLARLIARDGLDADDAKARIATQLPLSAKVALADHVITNDGGLDATRAQVREIHEALLARFLGGDR